MNATDQNTTTTTSTTNAASTETTNASASREKLMADLKLVIQDAEELLRSTGQQVGASYQAARARFESTLQEARGNFGGVQDRALTSSKDAMDAADRYVQANPWQSVGIGAAAGLLIGILLGRR